jgi:hypothetical protein
VPITIKVVSMNFAHGEVFSIQHYVVKFVSEIHLPYRHDQDRPLKVKGTALRERVLRGWVVTLLTFDHKYNTTDVGLHSDSLLKCYSSQTPTQGPGNCCLVHCICPAFKDLFIQESGLVKVPFRRLSQYMVISPKIITEVFLSIKVTSYWYFIITISNFPAIL